MSVSGIGASCNQSSSSVDSVQSKLKKEMQALASVLMPGTVSAVGSAVRSGIHAIEPVAAPPVSAKDSFRTDFAALVHAVQTGDMAAAQDALSALGNDRAAAYGPTGAAQGAGSTIGQDLQALTQAVQAGDAAAAQKALQSLQAAVQAHHHHGHHHRGTVNPDATGSTSSTPPVAASNPGDADNDGDQH